jgi:monofunctional biosynthetic peptidoglycan transglycosylase
MIMRYVIIAACVIIGLALINSRFPGLARYMSAQFFVTNSGAAQEWTMIDFADNKTVASWYSVNDGVMGGVSESAMTATSSGTAIFSGVVRFENNGGFATVQTDFNPARSMALYDGLKLQVRGDGKKYGVYLRNDTRRVLYQATFVTEKDTWQEVRLPWSAFVPTSFGRQVTAQALDPSAIRAMSLLIEFKQQGPFALEVKHIGAFEE